MSVRFHFSVDVDLAYYLQIIRSNPMQNMAVLFDLDFTLIDSLPLVELRQTDDIHAAKAANVYSIAALWGSLTPELLIAANPDRSCATVTELHDFLLNNSSNLSG
jgi:phosphoglycolate phosphatase-like HAD superfamily hydrolase